MLYWIIGSLANLDFFMHLYNYERKQIRPWKSVYFFQVCHCPTFRAWMQNIIDALPHVLLASILAFYVNMHEPIENVSITPVILTSADYNYTST